MMYHHWDFLQLTTATSYLGSAWEVLDGEESEALKVFVFEKKQKDLSNTN